MTSGGLILHQGASKEVFSPRPIIRDLLSYKISKFVVYKAGPHFFIPAFLHIIYTWFLNIQTNLISDKKTCFSSLSSSLLQILLCCSKFWQKDPLDLQTLTNYCCLKFLVLGLFSRVFQNKINNSFKSDQLPNYVYIPYQFNVKKIIFVQQNLEICRHFKDLH